MNSFKKNIYRISVQTLLPFKWSPRTSYCIEIAGENTGYLAYTTLVKVTDDIAENPLDVNGELCTISGLPQASKSNTIGQPDYVAPIYDIDACPTHTGVFFSYKRDGTQDGNPDPSFHTPIIEYTDEDGNPQICYPSRDTDDCSAFYAISIEHIYYAIPC